MAGTNEAHLIGTGGIGFALRLGDQVIGPAGADMALGSAEVGRKHAHVYWDGTTATLTDAGCANGTLVNGDRVVGAQRLRTGDVVRVGGIEFRFEEQG
jgi:pSer/pThr/pTyr-binding forkhead associated (FHA) protein